MPAGYSEEEDPLTLEEQKAQSTQNATPTPEPVEEEDDEGDDDEPEQLGPFAPVDIDNPVGQFMEDASVAILDAFSDKDADEIREERATQRAITGEKGKAIEERMAADTSIQRELAVAAAGGVEDFAEGVVNLPGDVLSLIPGVDNDFMNVDFTFVRENNTEWGQAVRTLARYVVAGRQATRLPGFNKLTAGQQGAALAGGRAVEGFIEDFIGSDGTGEDSTILGSTPWTQAFQTSDANNPIANRALNGLEGALFNAIGGKAIDAIGDLRLWSKFRSTPFGRKVFPGVKQDPKASAKATAARKRLNNLLAKTYAGDQFGETLNYTLKVQQDFAFRALEDARRPLNNLIEQAAEGDADVAAYLGARTRGLAAARVLDEAYDTVKYGGDPAEQVIDGHTWPGLQRQMDLLDSQIAEVENMSAGLDTRVADLSENLTQQSALSGRRAADIKDLQARSIDAPRQADLEATQTIPLNLSAYQVKYLKDNKLLPRGITITNGRRVKGLTSSNIDELIQAVQEGPEAKVKGNLLKRLPNLERPAPIDESIDTIEGLNNQVKTLQAEAKAADEAAALQRQELEPLFGEQVLARQMSKQLKLEREAMYSRFNGQDLEFKAKAEEIKAKGDPDIPPEKVDEIVQKSEQVQPTTRKKALEAGRESDQLIPTRPRIDPAEPPRTTSNVGTARRSKSQLTEANIRSLARDQDEYLVLRNLAGETPKSNASRNDAQILEQMQGAADELFSEIKQLQGDEIDLLMKSDTRFGTLMRDSIGDRFILTVEGREAINKLFRQTMVENKELGQTIHNQIKEGAAEVQMNLERLNERFLMMYNILKGDDAAKGSMLRELAVIADNTGDTFIDPTQREIFQKILDNHNDRAARQEATYNALLALGDEIRTNPKAAQRKLSRAIDVMAFSHGIAENQFNIWRSVASANIKNLDGFYINSLLSGPATQARNFWGNFYQATGHPVQALFGSYLAGKAGEPVRHQAVAAIGATYEAYREITDLIPRIWNDNAKGLDFGNTDYMIWDENLTKRMAKIQEMEVSGQLNWGQRLLLGWSINMHKLLGSPFFQPMMRAMGTVDSFFKVVAGRQTIARRAVEDALAQMGDRPLTGRASEEFAELVETYKKQHELDVFAEDKLTLIDPEAEDLARVFTFQQPISESNSFVQGLNTLATVPGARLLGLTFVKTPSQILKGAINMTPGVTNLVKQMDAQYKNGDDYYRAMRDGQSAIANIIGISAGVLGMTGNLTGAGPLTAENNKKWRNAGNKPFTLKVGSVEINYQGLEPMTTIIGFMADTGAVLGAGDFDGGTVPAFLASNIINKSFLAQVASAAEIFTTTEEGKAAAIGGNIVRGITPYSGARNQIGQLLDPIIREHRAKNEPAWSWFLKKNGGLGSTAALPGRPDPLTGGEMTRDGFGVGGGNMLALINMGTPLGLRFSLNRTDPVHKKLFDAGVNIDEEMRTMINGGIPVDLTNEEMSEFRSLKAADGALRADLLEYFNSPQYTKVDLPATEQQRQAGAKDSSTDVYKAVTNIIRGYSTNAKNVMKLGYTEASKGLQRRLEDAMSKRLEIDDQTVQRDTQIQFPNY